MRAYSYTNEGDLGNMEFEFQLAENSSDVNVQNSSRTDEITLARGYTSLAVLFVSCVLFLAALYNVARKKFHYHRSCNCCCRVLVDYFTSPFFLLALISILPVAAYGIVLHELEKNIHLDSEFCRIPGWLLLWFESSETLCLAVFSVYFLVFYIPFYNQKTTANDADSNEAPTERTSLINKDTDREILPKASRGYWLHSVLSVLSFVTILAVCGVYTMPPVVRASIRNGRYDKVGSWCWIDPSNAHCYFWFIEECVFMLISFIALTSSLLLLCCCVTREEEKRWPKKCFRTIWWDKLILVPFLIFYVYFLIQFGFIAIEPKIHPTCTLKEKPTELLWVWYIYSIGKPISKVLVVASALQLMSTSYRVVKKKDRFNIAEDGE